MKKTALILFLSCSYFLIAQTNRFVYQVSMKPSTQDASLITEKAFLDISPGKSIFYGEKRLLRDSLLSRMQTTKNWDRSQLQNVQSKIDFIIEKDPAAQTILYRQRIGMDNYEYPEERKMVWKIFPETTTIGTFKVQKAETDFGGRHWTAWFAPELPFQDGPYKFSGLPGLIIKAEDRDGDYSFDLEEHKKIQEMTNFQQRGNTIKVNRKDFKNQLQKFEKDPVSAVSGRNFGGRGVDPQRMKDMEKRMKEEIDKNNNPIEKD